MSVSRRKWLGAFGAALVVFALYQTWSSGPKPVWSERHLHYSLNIRNKSGSLVENTELVAFSPVQETSHQRTVALKVSEKFEESKDELGNRVLKFRVTVPPYGSRIISFDAAIETSSIPSRQSLYNQENFLREEKYIQISSVEVQSIVEELKKSSPVTSQKIYDWVSSHLKKSSYVRDDLGAAFAARERKGDCTEFGYLFVALARSFGIPARLVGGFVVARGDKIRTQLYHNWAEFYEDGAWQIADPHSANFKQNQDEYIAFRIIGNDETSPLSGSERFLAFDPKLEVTLE